MRIAQRLADIRERVQEAAERAGRDPKEIEIMAVSKFQPRSRIDEAIASGIRYLGESRVQEVEEKYEEDRRNLPENVELHFVGQLQRNKVAKAVRYVDCIQSVDRDPLILEIVKRCERIDKRMGIYFELLTAEETKGGYLDFDSLMRGVEMALLYEHLEIKGLMTMAPFVEDEKEIRHSFRALAACRELLVRRFPQLEGLKLSMGMSNDFEIAIEEGADIIRIGSRLFEGIQV